MTNSRKLAAAWFALALVALGASALLAVALVAARTPFLGLGGGVFRTALVLHVSLGVVVWFLAVAAGTWTLTRDRANTVGWGLFALAAISLVALIVSPLLSVAPPVLANYLPVLDSPVFLTGLVGILIATAGSGLLSLTGGWRRPGDLHGLAARWAVLAVVAAAVVFAIDHERSSTIQRILPVTLDDRLWGVGHLLQFVHNLLLVGAWLFLGQRYLAAVPTLARLAPWAIAITALATLLGPAISLGYDVGSADHRQAYTDLMRWATWPAPLLVGCGLLFGAWRLRREGRGGAMPGEGALLASMAIYAVGCLVGATIHGNATTAVPAHYHGTVGAVTLAYLAIAARESGRFGLRLNNRWLPRLPLFYGLGIGILVAGLAWSGALGIPRKAPHAELLQSDPAYLIAMGLAGVGGFLALGAVLAFVGGLGAGALGQRGASAGSRRRDVRYRALALTSIAVLIGGLVVDWLPGAAAVAPVRAEGHVAEKRKAEIEERFAQGVVMLHTKQYEHALASFHRVIELAPQMPEAYVNTGFALLGLGKHAAARDFFDEATNLRRDQINGYYGLALALEGMNDTFGAMQAMETYLHRAPKDDPYRRKAEAAVWEWRARLDTEKAKAASAKAPKSHVATSKAGGVS